MCIMHLSWLRAGPGAAVLLSAATVLGAETWPLGVALSGQLCRLVLRGAGPMSDLSTAALLGPHNWSKLTHLDIQGAEVRTLRITIKAHVLQGVVSCLQALLLQRAYASPSVSLLVCCAPSSELWLSAELSSRM